MHTRRHLLAAGVAASLAPFPSPFRSGAMADEWGEAFSAALQKNRQLLGWQSAAADRIEGVARVEGRLPETLRGVLYRNGPAVHDRFGLRYRHWFEGDGMLQAFRFEDAGVKHRGRLLETPKFRREAAAGRRLFEGFATPVESSEPVRRPDDVNVANISVLDHHGELLALWEAGSASVIDRERLEWSGFKVWGDGLEGLPFTAHPKVEPDGTLWAFGYSLQPQPMLVLYHIARDGTLVKAAPVDVGPLGMVHDFVVTERHLVIVIPPYVFDPEVGSGMLLDGHVWRPELGSRTLVVSKDDFADRRWYQLPAGFGFHHGNGWEEADGTIRLDHCVASDPSVVKDTFHRVMRGELSPASPERYTSYILRPDGSAEVETAAEAAEFPRVAPAVVGRRNRFVYTLGGVGGAGWRYRRIVKRSPGGGELEAYDYGEGVIPEEQVFVPRPEPRSEDDGWLVGTVLAYERGVTGVSVIDARRVGDGPVALAWLDYPLPLGFHGWFTPS